MATPVPATGAQMLEPAFREVVKKEIGPGMTPDGSAFAGNFQEGQTLEQPFQVQPGKCYTIVASSLGITELDAQVVFQLPPMPPYVAAQDQQSGPIATIGTKGNCIKNPFPVGAPAKVVLKATSGAGLAMAQIYLK